MAATDYRAGEDALHERDVRREGLAISLMGLASLCSASGWLSGGSAAGVQPA